MLFSYASNAVLSKARAMYGKSLKVKNFSELIACRDIPGITSYLKRKTVYSDVLADVSENNSHRSVLETRLNLKLFNDFASLGRYDLTVGNHFFEYFITRAEIAQLMHSVLLLSSGRSGEYIYTVPKFFHDHTKVNLLSLKQIRNYDDLLNVVKKSHYYKILLPFKPEYGESLNLTGIETALYNYLFKTVFEVINKYVKGKTKKDLTELFNQYIDLMNMVRIVRMRKFYKLNEDYIMAGLIDYGTFSKDQLRKFVQSQTDKQMMADIKNTSIGRKWFSRGLDVIDKIPINMQFNWCKHKIRFSIYPTVVLVSYIFLKEVEILNLTNIIEGVKYKLSAEEINKLLIK